MSEPGYSISESDVNTAEESSPLRVLVIDDSAADRDLFRRFLERQNSSFQCVEGEHGRAGLEQFRRVHPACVLLDLNLPDVDGMELLRSISREPGAGPVIVITAYGSERVAVEAMKSGAADYVVKGSVTGEGLAHVIRNAIEKRALQQEVERQRRAIEERNAQLESALQREREARNAVERSELRYRTLAEAMPQVVWTADACGWDYVNERWTRLTGALPEQARGSGWLQFVLEEDRARVAAAWRSATSQTVPLELDCRIVASDHSPRWQLMRALPLAHSEGPARWLGTFTDVDDQRRTEQILHHRQKLESIGILAGGVAHDFNNLLVGIIGGLSYTLEVLPENHDLRPILENAFRSGERAADLIRQMLAYSGKGKLQIENVDLAQNLRATWELIQASLARSVDLKVVIPPDLPPIFTDPAQLQQILMNLILNASESIPAERQGVIVVRAGVERVSSQRATWSGDLAPGDYIVLEVHDNGKGIEPALLNKIFDPFFTTKFTGRGLGLAAVLGIIRTNKGSVDVTSTPGTGTTFRVLLPAGTPLAESRGGALRGPRAAVRKGRILLVDDEAIVRETGKAVLEHLGHSVDVAASGRQALDLLSAGRQFSLVLLDLSMPGMDGKQTLHALRRTHPNLPVVICSGYADSDVRNRFEPGAVNGFLQKPFHFQSLSGKVAEVLAG
jgi:PAS domain S-box-containing protein